MGLPSCVAFVRRILHKEEEVEVLSAWVCVLSCWVGGERCCSNKGLLRLYERGLEQLAAQYYLQLQILNRREQLGAVP